MAAAFFGQPLRNYGRLRGQRRSFPMVETAGILRKGNQRQLDAGTEAEDAVAGDIEDTFAFTDHDVSRSGGKGQAAFLTRRAPWRQARIFRGGSGEVGTTCPQIFHLPRALPAGGSP